MTRLPQYLRDGWSPRGPGRCKCPGCGTICSTNALARARHKCPTIGAAYDVDGKPLQVGDTVQKVEWGAKAIHRLVQAIGSEQRLAGYVMVQGSIAWESSRNYRKVQS